MGTRSKSRGGDAGARIAAKLRDEILRGVLAPGTRIRQEDLADQFGASRVPVREALGLLVHEGLVTVIANSGAWVAQLTLAECEEVYLMRERLEPLLLRFSSPGLTESDLDQLQSIADEIRESDEDIDEFLRLDLEFHALTYSRASTQQLGDLVSKLWNNTTPYRRAYVASWSEESRQIANDEHNLMIASLRDGDTEGAERILEGHLRRTRRELARHPELFDDPSE